MVRMTKGLILIVIGVILYFPVSIGIQMLLPFPYGLFFTLVVPPGFFIAGIIFVIKDRNSPFDEKEIIYYPPKFCGKCGNKIEHPDTFCSNCGKEFKNSN